MSRHFAPSRSMPACSPGSSMPVLRAEAEPLERRRTACRAEPQRDLRGADVRRALDDAGDGQVRVALRRRGSAGSPTIELPPSRSNSVSGVTDAVVERGRDREHLHHRAGLVRIGDRPVARARAALAGVRIVGRIARHREHAAGRRPRARPRRRSSPCSSSPRRRARPRRSPGCCDRATAARSRRARAVARPSANIVWPRASRSARDRAALAGEQLRSSRARCRRGRCRRCRRGRSPVPPIVLRRIPAPRLAARPRCRAASPRATALRDLAA